MFSDQLIRVAVRRRRRRRRRRLLQVSRSETQQLRSEAEVGGFLTSRPAD